MTPDGAKDITTSEIFAGKNVVLFGVPGAFTPTCSNNHLPGYLENHDAILAQGVDTIAVVAVNDHHVMGAWARFTGGEGKILFLADGNGAFAKATGLDGDMSGAGMGVRTKRFSMIVDDGKVTTLNVETKPGVDESGAAHDPRAALRRAGRGGVPSTRALTANAFRRALDWRASCCLRHRASCNVRLRLERRHAERAPVRRRARSRGGRHGP